MWKEIQIREFQGSLVHLYTFMCEINRYNLESMALPQIWDYHWEEMTNWTGPSKQFLTKTHVDSTFVPFSVSLKT